MIFSSLVSKIVLMFAVAQHAVESHHHTSTTHHHQTGCQLLSLIERSSLSALTFCLMMMCCGCVVMWLDRVMSKRRSCNSALFCLPRIHVLTVNGAHKTSTTCDPTWIEILGCLIFLTRSHQYSLFSTYVRNSCHEIDFGTSMSRSTS